jgi:hypothetical protein
MWKLLHITAEKIARTGYKLIDVEQGEYVNTIVTMLPYIVPCIECQLHTEAYLLTNPFPYLQKDLYGADLREVIRTWLFMFHNYVRMINKQEPLESVNMCITLYADVYVSTVEYNILINCIKAATQQLIVKVDKWEEWYTIVQRLRYQTGRIIR